MTETKEKGQSGKLLAYGEQGWEGRIEYCFVPDSPPGPSRSFQEDRLQNGQFLRIFRSDGSVLWEGQLHFVPRRKAFFFLQHHNLPNQIYNDLTQKGVAYKDWIAWFWQGHPAKLFLRRPG